VNTRRADLGLSVTRVTGASSVVQLRGSYNLNAADHQFFDVTEDVRRSTGFGELSYSFTDQYNQFLVGAAFNADMANVKGPSASSASGTPIDYAYLTPALFLQNAFSITDHVSATATARGDIHSKYGIFFSPQLSVLLKPVENWSVRLSASHGFNAPTPFIEEVDPVGVHRVNGFESGAERAVGAETVDHGSIDVHGMISKLALKGTVFGTVIHHPVVAIPAAGGRYSFASSQFAHSARGAELSAVFNLAPLIFTGLYTYTDSRERSSLTSEVESAAPYVPRHTGGVDVAWNHARRGTRIALESFFTSRQLLKDDPALEVSKPYAVTGIQMSQKFGRFKLFANIENLTDVRQTKYAPVVLPARATDGRWTVTPWSPLEGRTFSVGVRLNGRDR
jgi:iron complex outermembrane receptor protein